MDEFDFYRKLGKKCAELGYLFGTKGKSMDDLMLNIDDAIDRSIKKHMGKRS